jgi:acyl carrier protein
VTTADRLRTFIVEELNWDGDPHELTPDYPLIERQVVDSLGITLTLTFLEEQFGVAVSDDELLPENFESIRRITEFIDAKRTTRA